MLRIVISSLIWSETCLKTQTSDQSLLIQLKMGLDIFLDWLLSFYFMGTLWEQGDISQQLKLACRHNYWNEDNDLYKTFLTIISYFASCLAAQRARWLSCASTVYLGSLWFDIPLTPAKLSFKEQAWSSLKCLLSLSHFKSWTLPHPLAWHVYGVHGTNLDMIQ